MIRLDQVTPTLNTPSHAPLHPPGLPPEEFILWLNGALDLLSNTPPSPEQWDIVRAKIAEQIGEIVARRMRDRYHAERVDTAGKVAQGHYTQASGAYAQQLAQTQALAQKLASSSLSAVDLSAGPGPITGAL